MQALKERATREARPNTTQEIAKFVQMINNKVQQIQTLTNRHNITTAQPLVTTFVKRNSAIPLTAPEDEVIN